MCANKVRMQGSPYPDRLRVFICPIQPAKYGSDDIIRKHHFTNCCFVHFLSLQITCHPHILQAYLQLRGLGCTSACLWNGACSEGIEAYRGIDSCRCRRESASCTCVHSVRMRHQHAHCASLALELTNSMDTEGTPTSATAKLCVGKILHWICKGT